MIEVNEFDMLASHGAGPGAGDELDLYNEPGFRVQSASAKEYVATSTGDGTDEWSTQPLIVERKPVYPVRQAVVPGMPEDSGTLRNRGDLEHRAYGADDDSGESFDSGNRIYALTVINSGPLQASVIQHVLQENAESFSVHDAQTEPWAYDTAATLPYTQPLDPRNTPVMVSPEYDQLL